MKYQRENMMMAFLDHPELKEYLRLDLKIESNDGKSSCYIDFTDQFKKEMKDLYESKTTMFADEYVNEILERINLPSVEL